MKMPNKPIGEGYKIFTLCDHGYTNAFEFYSRIKDSSGNTGKVAIEPATPLAIPPAIEPVIPAMLRKFTPCLWLLPYKLYNFSIYFDNYFSNIPLFITPRELGIGACGTAKSDPLPEALKIDKKLACKVLNLGHTSAVIGGNVL